MANDSENIILFKLKTTKSEISSLLYSTNDLIIRRGYDLNLITSKYTDYITDRQHKESTFIINYTLFSLVRCYLEVQSYFSEFINPDDKMNVADIYSKILNKPAPENTFLKEVQTINILPQQQNIAKTKTDIFSFRYKKIQSQSSNITDLMDSLKRHNILS